jgi:hypothetical protein
MSFTSMHNDHLDPDIHDAQPEPPCEQCRWGTEGDCVLTVGCQFDPITTAPAASALDVQVGGGHYKSMAIQPVEYIHKNGIGYIEGSVIKYVSRWRNKNGVEDLKKARHFLDLLIEMEV